MQLNGTIAFQKPKIGKGITNIQKKIKILFFIKEKLMKIGWDMASKYFLEERWNNIESNGGNRKSGILMSIDCTNLPVARHH